MEADENKTEDSEKEPRKQRTKRRGEETVSGAGNSRTKRKLDGINMKALSHMQILRFIVPSKGDQKMPPQNMPQELAQDYSELKTTEPTQTQEEFPILPNVS